jgi:plastocyanin
LKSTRAMAAWTAALWIAHPGVARAGVIRGEIHAPARAASVSVHSDPYPGRADALPGRHAMAPPSITDAVVYLDPAPEDESDLTIGPHPELQQKNQSFVPRVIAIRVGTTVDFPNRDPIFHNVFSVSPAKRFDLGKYPKGHSRSVRFDKAGRVNVYCDIHSNMAAFILVLPNHYFTQPSTSGRFALPAVPAGSYHLRVWHPDFGEIDRDVEVPASGDATVDLSF